MYPSSTSSSSQGSMGPRGGGLMRCDSAPSSLLTNALGPSAPHQTTTHHLAPALFFPTSHASEPSNPQNDGGVSRSREANSALGLHQPSSYNHGFPASAGPSSSSSSSSSSLVRHSSSPAGFLNQLAAAAGHDNGFSISRGFASYNAKGVAENSRGNNISRLNSQLSFTRQEGLPRISEESESESVSANISTVNGPRKTSHSYANGGFGMGSWDDGSSTNPTMFSMAQGKRAKGGNVTGIDAIESHESHVDFRREELLEIETKFQFSIPQGALEMATMDKLLHIPQDSVPCKIRAKRGCATHPRSIAERERRTRISGKLKKLQDLVPNMDKQTSYADMLDLAVQHIKSLQNQVQKLNKELDHCTCGCKKGAAEHK